MGWLRAVLTVLVASAAQTSRPRAVVAASASTPPLPPPRRKVNWHTVAGGIARQADGLNNTGFYLAHPGALTGYFPCCGWWSVAANGSFTAKGGDAAASFADLIALGVEVTPLGSVDNALLLDPSPAKFAAAANAAAEVVVARNWSGLVVDDEQMAAATDVAAFADFIGNMSLAMRRVGRRFVVDVASDWQGDIVGPAHLAAYAGAAGAPTLMDMATYFGNGQPPGQCFGRPSPRTQQELVQKVANLKALVPTAQIALGLGLTGPPGAANASCGGFPQCTNLTDPSCGCCECVCACVLHA